MTFTIHNGDALQVLRAMAEGSVQCCITSPPYWGLRDYGVSGQLGLERTPDEYVSKMVEVKEPASPETHARYARGRSRAQKYYPLLVGA